MAVSHEELDGNDRCVGRSESGASLGYSHCEVCHVMIPCLLSRDSLCIIIAVPQSNFVRAGTAGGNAGPRILKICRTFLQMPRG